MIEKTATPVEPSCAAAPASFSEFASLRLDELVARAEGLRRALQAIRQDTAQATQLATELVIIEAEKMSLEGFLKGSATG